VGDLVGERKMVGKKRESLLGKSPPLLPPMAIIYPVGKGSLGSRFLVARTPTYFQHRPLDLATHILVFLRRN